MKRKEYRHEAYRRLKDIGFSTKEIAKLYGVTYEAVHTSLRAHAAPDVHAAYLARKRAWAEPWRRARGIKEKEIIPAERLAEIDRLRRQKPPATYLDIAQRLGMTRSAVAGAVWRHNLGRDGHDHG
jgi:predicted transcriptional regulator